MKYHQHSLWSDILVLWQKTLLKNNNISISSFTTEKIYVRILKITSVLILWAKKETDRSSFLRLLLILI